MLVSKFVTTDSLCDMFFFLVNFKHFCCISGWALCPVGHRTFANSSCHYLRLSHPQGRAPNRYQLFQELTGIIVFYNRLQFLQVSNYFPSLLIICKAM